MPGFLSEIFNQVKAIFARMTPAQKVMTFVVSATAIVGLIAVMIYSSRPNYRVAYSNLAHEDAAAIVEKLTAEGVTSRLRDGGTTIEVPSDKVNWVRITMAKEGLPKPSSQGFDIFDQLNVGMTESVLKINEQRAYAGWLEQAYSSMEQIESARVVIRMPKRSPFAGRMSGKPSASIKLTLSPGRTLSPKNVDAVVYLAIAAGGSGMTEADVTVVDQKGNLLTSPRKDPESAESSELREGRKSEEDALARKAMDMIEEAIGPGKVTVRVALTLDQTRQREQRKIYDPDKTAVRSERTTTNDMQGEMEGAQAASTDAKLDGQDGSPERPLNTENREDVETEYDNSSTIVTIDKNPGNISRMTVAMILDESLKERRQEFENVVKSAVGFDSTRGDDFQSTTFPFVEIEAPPEFPPEEGPANWMILLIRHITEAVTVIAVVLILRGLFLRRKKEVVVEEPEETSESREAAQAAVEAMLPIPENQTDLRNTISAIVNQDPVQSARILSQWLFEESESEMKV